MSDLLFTAIIISCAVCNVWCFGACLGMRHHQLKTREDMLEMVRADLRIYEDIKEEFRAVQNPPHEPRPSDDSVPIIYTSSSTGVKVRI